MDYLVWFVSDYDCRFVGRASGEVAAKELADRQLDRDFGARLGKGQRVDGVWLPGAGKQMDGGASYKINAKRNRVSYLSVFISPVGV